MDSNLLYLHVLVSCQEAAAAERKRSLRRCMVSCTWLASDLPNLMNLPMQPHSFPYFPCLVIIKVVVPMGAAPFHRKDPGPAVAGKRRLHIKELLHCSAATPLSSTSTFAGLVWCKIDHNVASKMDQNGLCMSKHCNSKIVPLCITVKLEALKITGPNDYQLFGRSVTKSRVLEIFQRFSSVSSNWVSTKRVTSKKKVAYMSDLRTLLGQTDMIRVQE